MNEIHAVFPQLGFVVHSLTSYKNGFTRQEAQFPVASDIPHRLPVFSAFLAIS